MKMAVHISLLEKLRIWNLAFERSRSGIIKKFGSHHTSWLKTTSYFICVPMWLDTNIVDEDFSTNQLRAYSTSSPSECLLES